MGDTPLGQRFGSRVVEATKGGRWYMRCDCGVPKWCRRCDVLAGRASRCLSCAMTRHGHARRGESSRLYNIWRGVIHRCHNPASNRWHCYGGRGISVHPPWRTDFAVFAAAVGEPPTKGHTLDRIDVDGNYEPGNVRWATALEQAANKRSVGGENDDWDWSGGWEDDDAFDPWAFAREGA